MEAWEFGNAHVDMSQSKNTSLNQQEDTFIILLGWFTISYSGSAQKST